MPARNTNLIEQLDRFREFAVASRQYGKASEVVREGQRVMERRNTEGRAKLEWLRGAIQVALDQIDRGALTEIRSEDELERHIDQFLDGSLDGSCEEGRACPSWAIHCESLLPLSPGLISEEP